MWLSAPEDRFSHDKAQMCLSTAGLDTLMTGSAVNWLLLTESKILFFIKCMYIQWSIYCQNPSLLLIQFNENWPRFCQIQFHIQIELTQTCYYYVYITIVFSTKFVLIGQ